MSISIKIKYNQYYVPNLGVCFISSLQQLWLKYWHFPFLFGDSINYALHCLRRNDKFHNNITGHLIITIFFTPIPGSYIWGPIYIYQIEKSQAISGGGRAAQTVTISCAQTIRSAFKSSHSFRENKERKSLTGPLSEKDQQRLY